ncbi:hypothetical protein [Paenibacillus pabuli]|uniref:hypothetical protein n=1 Tax=Paenibacillus pabuli TaxID=1472 RepID=UPI003242C72E
MITEEDGKVVKMFILIPVAEKTLDVNIKRMRKADLKIPELFIGQLILLQDELIKKYRGTKIRMRELGIKVLESQQNPDGIFATYKCRGYEHKMNLRWELIRSDIMTLLSEMMDIDLDKLEVLTDE